MSTPQTAIEALGLTVSAVFVPQSQSRNAKEVKTPSDLSLNWRVTVNRNGRPVIETDYMQGIGHVPAYNRRDLGHANSLLRFEALKKEAETGRHSQGLARPLPAPTAADVLYSLCSDAGALDYASFEDWAADFGFDTDSREAERIYRACLDIGLKLRAAIGDAGLEQLREAFQDY